MSDEAPPGRARGVIWRGLLAGVLIMLSTAAAVGATGLLQVEDILDELRKQGRAPIEIPEIDRADAGKAQTLMILGSDRRFGDKEAGIPPRSDTIILVRLDPDKEVIAMTSIPRDLLVEIPGIGSQVKINAAYENFGERGAVRAVKKLLSIDGKPFPINHVVTVDFGGFRRAIDYIGCVYADIDRDYFNDQSGPGGYAVIDIDPGYQKLCGTDALAYVRYRHGDNDLVRAARQQDFLRQVRSAKGTKELMEGGIALGNLKKLARVFGRYFDRDKSLDSSKEVFKFAKTVLFTAGNPVREVRFRVTDAPDKVNLVASEEMLRGDGVGVHRREGVGDAARARPSRPTADVAGVQGAGQAPRATSRPSIQGLEEARAEGENQAILGVAQDRLPVLLPDAADQQRRRTRAGAAHVQDPRRAAARSTTRTGSCSPRAIARRVLRRPGHDVARTRRSSTIRTRRSSATARKLMVYRDGKRDPARRVAHAARPSTGSRTRSRSRSRTQQMIGIASSLQAAGRLVASSGRS